MADTIKEYEIWSEGYAATGEHQSAYYYGKAMGETFKEACENFRYPEDIIREYDKKVIVKKGDKLNLDDHYSEPHIWGCKLYDNEKDARKYFG